MLAIFSCLSSVPEFVRRVKSGGQLFGAVLFGIPSSFSTLAKSSHVDGLIFFLEINFYNGKIMVLGNLTESLQIFVVFLRSHSNNDDIVNVSKRFTKIVLLDDVDSPFVTPNRTL